MRFRERYTQHMSGARVVRSSVIWLASWALIPMMVLAGSDSADEDEPAPLLGTLTRAEIESALPDWLAEETPEADFQAAVDLVLQTDGSHMDVYFGTWCSDSRREIARFWQALDAAGGRLGFTIRYVGVDREKEEPAELLHDVGLEYVPTFVVYSGDTEVGRVVEESPNGIEVDLLQLLSGEVSGVVSVRDDLEVDEPLAGGVD